MAVAFTVVSDTYRDPRVKATQKEIARQLHANWQADGLLRLKQELQTYHLFQTLIAECDQELAKWPSCCVPFPIVALALRCAKIHAKVDARKQGNSAIRFASVALSDERRGPSPDRRHSQHKISVPDQYPQTNVFTTYLGEIWEAGVLRAARNYSPTQAASTA